MDEDIEFLCKHLKLNAKEKRLFLYFLDPNNSRVIGDICKNLHTTVMTLLTKTEPNLRRKLKIVGIDI